MVFHVQPILRTLFVLALALTLTIALLPMAGPSVGDGDKVQHFFAFYALALLGGVAFPHRRRLPWLILGLSAFGALIEVLQAVTPFGRSCDMMDWVADNLGLGAAYTPLLLGAWRSLTQSRQ
jgi:VanZ family protein